MNKLLLLLLILVAFNASLFADSWIDPDWNKMLDKSSLVAVVEYTETGDYNAYAKIIKVYQGDKAVSDDEILISGFSNRYGPIDSMGIGDRYVVFLRKSNWNEETIAYSVEKAKTDTEMAKKLKAHQEGKLFYVWSPTSGDYRILGDSVEINFIRTTMWRGGLKQSYVEVDDFLTNRSDARYHHRVLDEIKFNVDSVATSQNLLKLAYGGYNEMNSMFSELVENGSQIVLFGLTKLLGNIQTKESENLLLSMYDRANDYVRGVVVQTLMDNVIDPDFLSLELSKKLHKDNEFSNYEEGLMNPVRNSAKGGGVELVSSLAKLKYREDEDFIVNLLTSSNSDALFEAGVAYLDSIESNKTCLVLSEMFSETNEDVLYEVVQAGIERRCLEIIEPLKNYIDTVDRNSNTYIRYLFSECCGIGAFKDTETKKFIIKDFYKFLSNYESIPSRKQKMFFEDYAKLFSAMEIKNKKDFLYAIMSEWYGTPRSFKDKGAMESHKQIQEFVLDRLKDYTSADSVEVLEVLAVPRTPEGYQSASVFDQFGFYVKLEVKNSKPDIKYLLSKVKNIGEFNIATVFIQTDDHTFYLESPERFNTYGFEQIIRAFTDTVKEDPNRDDIEFLRNIVSWPVLAKKERMIGYFLDKLEKE